MKSLTPPSTAAIAILASSVGNNIRSVSADTFPVPVTALRFKPFQNLDSASQNIAENKLGYTAETWNNYGLATVEKKGWDMLTSNEREGAIQLGYTEGQWNCFINHYEHLTWEELETRGVQQLYRNLGWTETHWNNEADDVPYTESRWWDMLTDNEKASANKLCYNEQNWDKLDMNPNDTFFPHPMPNFRYSPWDTLSAVEQNVAGSMLGYTEDTWNDFGTAIVEKNTFLNLSPDQREGALELGFYTHTWDCFMNHYLSYYWSSFHEDLRVAIETLGWTEEMWADDSTTVPASEDKIWADLTPEEKAAATRLCYFKEIWDGQDITSWYDYDAGKNTAITGNGPVPQDIDLDIFQETGYVGRAPGSVGAAAYTASSSSKVILSSSVLVGVASMMAFLFF